MTAGLDLNYLQSIDAFAERVIANSPDLNVLFNNAGVMRNEAIGAARDLADATITTNLLDPTRLINALIDHLSHQPDAAIINSTSGLAYVPLIFTPTYNATKAGLRSYTVALREVLKGKVEVIELAPPAVQTSLTPGQETREGYMPLADLADEAIALLSAQPSPPEVLVERVRFLRNAEREGRFERAFTALNSHSWFRAVPQAASFEPVRRCRACACGRQHRRRGDELPGWRGGDRPQVRRRHSKSRTPVVSRLCAASPCSADSCLWCGAKEPESGSSSSTLPK